MKIFVKVRAGARENKIEKLDDSHFNIWVLEPAKENRANFAVWEALAGYLNIPKSRLRLVFGHRSRDKVFELGSLASK